MKRIGIGFDAWGSIARTHVTGLRALPVLFERLPFEIYLAGVATRRPEVNGPWIRQAGFAAVYGSVSDLLADPAVDGLDICTPNALHTETAKAAWATGKGVYTEKPLAEHLEQASAMVTAWRAAGSPPSQVAFNLRFTPAVARAKDYLTEGRIGEVLTFRARMVHGGYLDLERLYTWRLDAALAGGGALTDLGIHLIDLVHFLLGPTAEVAARTRTFITERPTAMGGRAKVLVDDWGELTVTLASGAVGTIEATRAGDGQEETTLELFGREGSLRISNGQLTWFDRRKGVRTDRSAEAPGPYLAALLKVLPPARLTLGPFVDSHTASLHWWLRRLADPSWADELPALAASPEDGLAAQRVLHEAYTAAARS